MGQPATVEARAASLEDIARAALERANGDTVAATAALEAELRADAALFRAALDPWVHLACRQMVTKVIRRARDVVWKSAKVPAPANDPETASARVVHLARGNLLSFPLPGGLLLADATKAEVSKAANNYQAQGTDMLQKGLWLEMIADKLPSGKKVKDIFTDEKLAELKRRAEDV